MSDSDILKEEPDKDSEEEISELATSHIQTIQSTPPYISTFINNNLEQLNKIYEEGLQMFDCGILGFQCSQENNKMDVQFMNDEMMCEILEKESVMNLKNNIQKDKILNN